MFELLEEIIEVIWRTGEEPIYCKVSDMITQLHYAKHTMPSLISLITRFLV